MIGVFAHWNLFVSDFVEVLDLVLFGSFSIGVEIDCLLSSSSTLATVGHVLECLISFALKKLCRL